MTDEVQSANQLMQQFSEFDESPLTRLSEWARQWRAEKYYRAWRTG